MLPIQNHSDTAIIVVHEIYGVDEHILDVCNRLAQEKYDVLCPNLLMNRQTPFKQSEEPAAYQYFMQNVGFELAKQQIEALSRQIRDQYRTCFIVGYSVGATTAWLCSQYEGLYNGIICFYGSRIRDYQKLEPQCPTLLFFPKKEIGFEVDELLQTLTGRHNVSVAKVNALHGFTDPWSEHYCEAASKETFAKTLAFIEDSRKVR